MTDRNKSTEERPNPAEFEDYREYLHAIVAYLQRTQRGFSYRRFAQKAGYASPSFLKLVLAGERGIALKAIPKFVRGLGLNEKEARSFEALVFLHNAQNDSERNRQYARLRRMGATSNPVVSMQSAQYEVYKRWYGIPIREMMLFPDFQEDPQWIAQRMRPPIRPAEAKRALELLLKVGLARRDEDGRIRPADVKLVTPPVVRSLSVRNFHRAMLRGAERSLDGMPLKERHVSSVTLCLTRKQYDMLCERLIDFQDEIADQIEDGHKNGVQREVYWIGHQIIPMTGLKSKDHEGDS